MVSGMTELESFIFESSLSDNDKSTIYDLVAITDNKISQSVQPVQFINHLYRIYSNALVYIRSNAESHKYTLSLFQQQKDALSKLVKNDAGVISNSNNDRYAFASVLAQRSSIQNTICEKSEFLRFCLFHVIRVDQIKQIQSSKTPKNLFRNVNDVISNQLNGINPNNFSGRMADSINVKPKILNSFLTLFDNILNEYIHDPNSAFQLDKKINSVSSLPASQEIVYKKALRVLDGDETGNVTEQLIKNNGEEEKQSVVQKDKQVTENRVDFLRHARNHIDSLLLPASSANLTLSEKQEIVQILLEDIKQHRAEAVLVMLMLLTSKSIDELLNADLSDDTNCGNNLSINTGLCAFTRKSLPLEKAYQPADNFEWSCSHTEYLTVPLPNCLNPFLSRKTMDDKKLSCLFSGSISVTEYLLEVNHKINYSRRELSKKSIQYAIFDEVAQMNDGVLASLLFATDAYSNPITLYYTSASSSFLLLQYKQALINVGISDIEHNIKCKTATETYLGSQVVVETDFLASRISKKREQIVDLVSNKRALDKNDVVELHNNLALFTASLLAFNCFSRDSKELYFDEHTINVQRKLILVSDKLTELSNHIRFVPLTSIAASQMAEYKRHLKFTSQKLMPTEHALSLDIHRVRQDSLNANLPFLFVINEQMEMQSISSKEIVNYIEPSLPNNFFRHYMASNLSQTVVPYRQSFLGHFNEFQQPFSDISTQVPDFPEEVYTQLNETLLALFDKPVQAIKTTGANPEVKWELSTYSYHRKWYDREINNIEAVKQLKSTLFSSFSYLLKETNSTQLSDGFNALHQRLIQDCHVSPSILSKHVNNCLQYFKKTNKTKLRKKFLRNQANSSARLNVILLDKCLDYYRRQFLHFMCYESHNERALILEDKKQSIQNRLLLKFYLSMLLFQPSAFNLLYHSRAQSVSVRVIANTVFLEFGTNHVNCIAVNTLSSSFLLALLEKNITHICTPKKLEFEAYYRLFIERYIKQYSYIVFKSTVKAFLCWIQLARAMDTPLVIVTDRKNNNMISTSYPLDAYARLLTNKPFFMPYSHNISVDAPLTHAFFLSNRRRIDEKALLYSIINALKIKSNSTSNISTSDILIRSWASAVKSSSTSIKALIEASRELSEIAVSLLIYAYYLTNTTIKSSTKRYKASTIISYFSTVCAALHKNLFNVQITSLDESTFFEIYTKAIKRAKRNKNNDATLLAHKLKDFHTEVSRYFAMAEPEWGYFPELQEVSQGNIGIARLFTETDYLNVYTHIELSTKLADFERDLHLFVLTLGFRLGMRPREIKNLHLHQISDSIITITSSRLAGVKSTNSARRLNYSHYLSDKEISILNKVHSSVSRYVTNRKEVAIFANATQLNELINFNQIINNITHVMRHVSYHPKIRFYDLRHSFINYHYWLMSTAIDDARYVKELQKWGRTNDLKEFRAQIKKNHLGNAPDVGATWAVAFAKEMGHSILTQRQYYHNNILGLEELNANEILSDYLSCNEFYGLHVKDDNRYKKNFNKQVRLRLGEYSEQSFIKDASDSEVQPIVLRSSLQHVDSYHQYLLIYHLIMLQPRFTQTVIAEKLRCDESFVETVLQHIAHYIINTNCRCIDLRNFKSYKIRSLDAEVKKTYNILSKKFVSEHLINTLLIGSAHDNFVKIWTECADSEKLLVNDTQLEVVKSFANASNITLCISTKEYKRAGSIHAQELHSVRLISENSKQSLNFKLSFLMSIVYVIKQLTGKI